MAYVKQEWKDEVLNGPEQYNITAPGTNINGAEITLSTPITQIGTPVTAERMNKIEQGIFDAHNYSNNSFIPVLYGSISAGAPEYDIQVGNYVKIGKLVTVEIYLVTKKLTGVEGNIMISGLPFPSALPTIVPFEGLVGEPFNALIGWWDNPKTSISFAKSGGLVMVTRNDYSNERIVFTSVFNYFTYG